MKYSGALPSQMIVGLVENGFMEGASLDRVCTDTYDPVVSGELYRLSEAFLPPHGRSIRDMVQLLGTRINPDSILEKGVHYIYRIQEKIAKPIPDGSECFANPKSNIGRVDILTRLIVDGASKYDYVPPGFTGELWSLVNPRSFPVIAGEGVSFNQLRFINQRTRLDEIRLGTIFDTNALLYDRHGNQVMYNRLEHSDRDGSILLSLGFDFNHVGFEAIENGEPIRLNSKNQYDPRQFFREIRESNSCIKFRPHSFCILSTEESVRIPDFLTCEMRPTDARLGEIRVHYAGFIAPGWGIGADGKAKGKPLTLEVRSFESGFVVFRGQPFAKIRLERMIERPVVHYDQQPSVNFAKQTGPGLAKYFKEW